MQKRNKPIEPPKAEEKAPFFLPTLPGVVPTFIKLNEKDENEEQKSNSTRIKNTHSSLNETYGSELLKQGEENLECEF